MRMNESGGVEILFGPEGEDAIVPIDNRLPLG
jgi:hypothetical protein